MSDKVFEYYLQKDPNRASEFWVAGSLKAEGIKHKVWGQFDIYLIHSKYINGDSDCLVDVGSDRFSELTALLLQGKARVVTVEQQRRAQA